MDFPTNLIRLDLMETTPAVNALVKSGFGYSDLVTYTNQGRLHTVELSKGGKSAKRVSDDFRQALIECYLELEGVEAPSEPAQAEVAAEPEASTSAEGVVSAEASHELANALMFHSTAEELVLPTQAAELEVSEQD